MANDNIDALIADTGGCGLFQIIHVLSCYAAELCMAWTMMVMSFGKFNPGMECVPTNLTTLSTEIGTTPAFLSINSSLSLISAKDQSVMGFLGNGTLRLNSTFAGDICDCPGEIRFKDSASTIVTEWNLVCGRSWIASLIISLQMVGVVLGAPVGGPLATRFGRKFVMYGSLAANAALSLICVFSVSWVMFAILRFFLGVAFGTLYTTAFVYCSEFLTNRWRGILGAIPDWSMSCVILSLVIMALKDWRYLHLCIAAVSLFSCVPALWTPESMRWLAVRGEVSKASDIAKKIASTNKKPNPNTDILLRISQTAKERDHNHKQPHSYIDLFRKDLRKISVMMGLIWFTLSVIFYGVSFGVVALHGDFYINYLVLNLTNVPASLTGVFIVNTLGRRLSNIIYFAIAAAACASIVGVHFLVSEENLAGSVIAGLAILCQVSVSAAWGLCLPWLVELYPTTIRTLAYSWVGITSRIGGIIAPYMIPKNSLPLYGSFIIMGSLIIMSCLCAMALPETKGRPLMDSVLEKQVKVVADVSDGKPQNLLADDDAADGSLLDNDRNQKDIKV